MKYIAFSLVSALAFCIAACSSNNQTERLTPRDSVVKYSSMEGYQDRFINLFPKFKDYPVTCSEDCYQPSELLTCNEPMEQCTFGGGCFWCVEAAYKRNKGVIDAVTGYAGGDLENPTYKEVKTKTTGHAEVVQVTWDPSIISFD